MDNINELLTDLLKSLSIKIILALLASYGLYRGFKRKDVESNKQVQGNKEGQSKKEKQQQVKKKNKAKSSPSKSKFLSNDLKMVLIVRKDLKMGPGKVAAQCSHAAVAAYKQATKYSYVLRAWENCSQPKITLRCDSEEELLELHETAKAIGLLSYVVWDAGRTQVAPGSKTVCSVGPGPAELVDQIAGHLKLY